MNVIEFPKKSKTAKKKKIKWDQIAGGVEHLVVKKLKEGLKTWKGDVGMRQMIVQDAADGLAVCEVMLEKQNWTDVEERLWEMDTAARDYVYEFIAVVAGKDFFDTVWK